MLSNISKVKCKIPLLVLLKIQISLYLVPMIDIKRHFLLFRRKFLIKETALLGHS